jgi:hypothetical protein
LGGMYDKYLGPIFDQRVEVGIERKSANERSQKGKGKKRKIITGRNIKEKRTFKKDVKK